MSPGFEPYDVAIAGAGLSGLSCAWALRRAGLRVIVLEASDDAGGCISTVRREGCIADGGPQTFALSTEFLELVGELDLESQLQRPATGAGSMFVFSRGRLVAAPVSPMKFLTTPLLSPLAKLRLLVEPLVGARFDTSDESLADFAARRGGRAVVDALVRPLVGGIFAGDPARLSARSAFPRLVESERRYTSVLVGALARGRIRRDRRPVTLRGGNDVLPRTLAARLAPDVRLRTRVTDVILRGAMIELGYDGAQPGSVVARHAVLALPAPSSGDLLEILEPEAADALRAIAYVPMAQVALSYPRSALRRPLDGFGFLSGERSGLRVLGCTWNSSMFADRCPPERVLFTAFVGGASNAGVCELRDDEVVRIAHEDLRRALGIGDSAPTVIAGFRWDRAIPQYEVGHEERLNTIECAMSRLAQVSLTGAYLRGPSTTDCIACANAVAEAIASRLHGPNL